MKKIFALMAMSAMLFVACEEKPDDPNDPNNPDNQEYVAPITIDGDFADWATLGDKVQVVKCAATASKTDLKTMKVYADKYYVFIYLEYDLSAYETLTTTNLDVHINGDNDTTTGGWKGQWDQGETPCIDLMCQGEVFDETGAPVDYNPGMYQYGGAANTSDWAWNDVTVADFITGKGTKKAIEIQMTRELYPLGKLAKEFTMGVEILVNGWDATGALPNTEATETNAAGEAPLMLVTYNK